MNALLNKKKHNRRRIHFLFHRPENMHVEFHISHGLVDDFFRALKLGGPSLLALGGYGEGTQKNEHDNKALHGLMLTCWEPKAKP